jgi:undecaprenyl-diphosphatase
MAAILILLIGLSRIYLGVHYPSDVAAGYLSASVWVLTVSLGNRLYGSPKTAAPVPEYNG